MCFSAIVGLAGAAMSAGAAGDAADAQVAAAKQDIAFQRETRDLIFDRLDPFYQPGVTAQNALAYELGLGDMPMIGGTPLAIEEIQTGGGRRSGGGLPVGVAQNGNFAPELIVGSNRGPMAQYNGGFDPKSLLFGGNFGSQTAGGGFGPKKTQYKVGDKIFNTRAEAEAYANANRTGATAYKGFQATPGYQFQLDQGNANINALAGSNGGLMSGATLQSLQSFGQGLANQEYNNYLNRLSGMSASGMSAASGQATAATNAANATSNAYAGIGNAQAAGAIGQANAWNQGIRNALSTMNYQQGINGGLASSPRPPSNPFY